MNTPILYLKSSLIKFLLRSTALNNASMFTLLSLPSLFTHTFMQPPGICSEYRAPSTDAVSYEKVNLLVTWSITTLVFLMKIKNL